MSLGTVWNEQHQHKSPSYTKSTYADMQIAFFGVIRIYSGCLFYTSSNFRSVIKTSSNVQCASGIKTFLYIPTSTMRTNFRQNLPTRRVIFRRKTSTSTSNFHYTIQNVVHNTIYYIARYINRVCVCSCFVSGDREIELLKKKQNNINCSKELAHH